MSFPNFPIFKSLGDFFFEMENDLFQILRFMMNFNYFFFQIVQLRSKTFFFYFSHPHLLFFSTSLGARHTSGCLDRSVNCTGFKLLPILQSTPRCLQCCHTYMWCSEIVDLSLTDGAECIEPAHDRRVIMKASPRRVVS